MAFKMKGWSGPFKQKSTISNEDAKGINIENISAVQKKNGKSFVVEVGDNEYYDPNAKNNIGGFDGSWQGNYNDTNNRRDTIMVSNNYPEGHLIDETQWEEGEATEQGTKVPDYQKEKKKSPMKQGVIMDDRTKKAMMLFPLVSDSDSIAKQKHNIVKEIYNSDKNKMDSIVDHHLKNNPIYQKEKKKK